jgi:hypothetical protein
VAGLSLRLGDAATARTYLQRLERPRTSPLAASLAKDAAGSIRAQLALGANLGAEAATALEEVQRLEARVGLIGGSPFYSRVSSDTSMLGSGRVRVGRRMPSAGTAPSRATQSSISSSWHPLTSTGAAFSNGWVGQRRPRSTTGRVWSSTRTATPCSARSGKKPGRD